MIYFRFYGAISSFLETINMEWIHQVNKRAESISEQTPMAGINAKQADLCLYLLQVIEFQKRDLIYGNGTSWFRSIAWGLATCVLGFSKISQTWEWGTPDSGVINLFRIYLSKLN